MQARTLRSGLVVLAVAVAGCSALAPMEPNTTSPTVSAAPVPSTTPTPSAIRLPPGVGRTGIADPQELTAAHWAILSDTNYTRTVNETTWGPNGSVIWQRTHVTSIDGARKFVVVTQAGTPVLHKPLLDADHAELYVRLQRTPAGSKVFAAITDDGRTDYRNVPHRFNSPDLYLLLSAFETRLAWKDYRGGTTVFRVEATSQPTVDGFQPITDRSGVGDPRNVTFQLLVDDRGVIRRYRLAYTTVVDGREVRYERTMQISAMGATMVGPPAWLDRFNGTATPDGTPTPTASAESAW